ncbi:MAG: cytochrome c maturation protein CcmE [Myxococcota bacterium]|nr:cytochrome c maturation protein CcmE [Myxococcota bacterium]
MTGSPEHRNPRVRAALALGALALVGLAAYLALDAFSTGSVYFRHVDELVAERGRIGNRKVKVSGALVAGSVEAFERGGRRFDLERNGVRLTIVTDVAKLPDGFGAPGQDVIADGTLDPQGVFHATLIATGCPSKYEARRDAASP